MREAFEAALRENPDDVAGWAAYADYLAEQGDPRGEFMQVQLALEDEARPKAERDALRARETDLLVAHEREWLGELAPFVLDVEPIYHDIRRTEAEFSRGWLTGLVGRSFSVAEARALARTAEARMLTRLVVEGTEAELPRGQTSQYIHSHYEPGPDVPDGVDEYEGPALHALAGAPLLAGVRMFRYGDGPTVPGDDGERHGQCHANGSAVHRLVGRMPRLEELYLYAHEVDAAALFALPLPRLRVLRYDHATAYPLGSLADNPTLGSLTHLLCHPHAQRPDDPDAYIRLDQLRAVCRSPHLRGLEHLQLRLTDFGDGGAEEVVASGLLKRLRVLDLAYGCVTDRGAAALAACPDLTRLALLDLTANAIGAAGVAALNATGVRVVTPAQHGEHPDRMEEHGWLEYLSYGDME